jgi:hypothetical protein
MTYLLQQLGQAGIEGGYVVLELTWLNNLFNL